MVYELLWVPALLEGKTVAEVGDMYEGDVLGVDFLGSWNNAKQTALEAVKKADLGTTVHLSYADVPAQNYINEVAGDILIHIWDVDQSIMCNLIIEEDLLQVVYDNTVPRKDEFASSGLFGKPLPVREDAGTQTRLLALLGRKAQ